MKTIGRRTSGAASARAARGKRRAAFTLVELLVAIACGAIVLATAVATALFAVKMNDKVISSSATEYKLSAMKDLVRENVKSADDEAYFKWDGDQKRLYFKERVVLSDVDILPDGNFLSVENGFLYFGFAYLASGGAEEVCRFVIGPAS